MRISESDKPRFWSKVQKTDTCWNWTDNLAAKGYGGFLVEGRKYRSHRYSYALHFGPIPKGYMICHICDNRACVRPDHLFLGTNKDNMVDCVRKGRNVRGERSHLAKLTAEDVIFIRTSGIPPKDLVVKYGVSRSNIYDIQYRRTWTHI